MHLFGTRQFTRKVARVQSGVGRAIHRRIDDGDADRAEPDETLTYRATLPNSFERLILIITTEILKPKLVAAALSRR